MNGIASSCKCAAHLVHGVLVSLWQASNVILAYKHWSEAMYKEAAMIVEQGADQAVSVQNVRTIVTLKVASSSRPNLVAGAIAAILRNGDSVDMQCVGAGAVNQAVKAIAIATDYVSGNQLDVMCRPSFAEISIDGQKRTAVHLVVTGCPLDLPVVHDAANRNKGNES